MGPLVALAVHPSGKRRGEGGGDMGKWMPREAPMGGKDPQVNDPGWRFLDLRPRT